MTQTHVLNREDGQREIPIVNLETKAEDIMFIQPFAKAKLPDGFVVKPAFLLQNKKIKEIRPTVTAPAATEETEEPEDTESEGT